jgi:hypothetical protein
VVISSEPSAVDGTLAATAVRDLIMSHLFDNGRVPS